MSTACQVYSDLIPPADYPFAIYQWRFLGLQEDLQLLPVTLNPILRTTFSGLIEQAIPLEDSPTPSTTAMDDLESEHYRLWCDARCKYRDETRKRGTFRLASLESSYKARRSLLETSLAKATEERIRRMHRPKLTAPRLRSYPPGPRS